MFVDMAQTFQGRPVNSIWINAHVAIDLNSFNLYVGVMIKKIDGVSDEETRQFQREYVLASQQAFDQEVGTWESKIRVDNPMRCDSDWPINILRQWYEQFYVDADKVPEK